LSNPFNILISIEYPREGALIEDGFVYGPEKSAIYFVPLSVEGDFIIPSSVTSIGDRAFFNCSGLASVPIPSSVTSIGNEAFANCTGLTSVVIPSSVTSIGDKAFGHSGVKDLIIQDCDTEIAIGSDVLVSAPVENLYIGRNLSYGRNYTISTEVKSVIIGNRVTSLPDYAFSFSEKLTALTIGSSVKSIGTGAFSYCTSLVKVIMPDSVTLIGDRAFFNCSGLASVAIGNSVQTIGTEAFSGCTGLTSVTIPSSVTSIGKYAFSGCTGLLKVAYPSGLSYPFDRATPIEYPREGAYVEDGFVYGPEKSVIYFAPQSVKGKFIIPMSVTSIGDFAFSDCTDLSEVIISDSIGDYAFSGCTGVTEIIISNSVTSIGMRAFAHCRGLSSVTIPSSVTSIGDGAFAECSGMKDFIIEDGETEITIGSDVLDSVQVENLYSGRNWSYRENYPLSTEVKSVIIGDLVTSLPDYAFYLCDALSSV